MEYIGSYILLVVMGLFAWGMYQVQVERYKMRMGLSDEEEVMDEVKEETYNGRPLWITEAERPEWEKLSREMKRSVVRETEKRIKRGELYVHTDETGFTGLITRKEAIEKGYIKDDKKISD